MRQTNTTFALDPQRAAFLAPFLAVFLATVPISAQESREPVNTPVQEKIRPESSGTLTPCCESGSDADPVNKSLVTEVVLPGHSLLDPEALARRKAAALVGRELPSAKALIDLSEAVATKERPAEAPLKTPPKALSTIVQFDGMNRVQAGHEGVITFPPDTIVAAGPSQVLAASNVALRLSDRQGRSAQTRSLNNFFGMAFPPLLFDPKVYYDRLSGRFFVVALSVDDTNLRSFIHLAVSRSSEPRGLAAPRDWCSYRIRGRVGRSWADYPGLGMNERWLGIGVNNFNFGVGFRSVFVYAIDKVSLVRNAESCPEVSFHRFKAAQDATGGQAFTVQPAQHYTASTLPGSPLFFVSAPIGEFTDGRYTLWRVVEEGDAPVLSRAMVEGNELYSFPPNAPQAGGRDLDTGDLRIQQAAFRDGRVWAVHTSACNFGTLPGESCVRVVGIDPSATGGTVGFEEIFGGGEGWFLWMPGIAVNARGDVAVVFQRSRDNMSAGVAFAGMPAGATGFEAVRRLVNGRCGLDNTDGSGRNRSGDYVGIQTDPRDDLGFWLAGEYSGRVAGLGCEWRTRVGLVRF